MSAWTVLMMQAIVRAVVSLFCILSLLLCLSRSVLLFMSVALSNGTFDLPSFTLKHYIYTPLNSSN